MKSLKRHGVWLLAVLTVLVACSSDNRPEWVEDEVTFVAGDLTIYGTYRHQRGDKGPAALLISESGPTDRNGDNAVVGPIANMRKLAELLSDRGVASLRYDKVGTGDTGLGPYKNRTADVGTAVYVEGATAAVKFLAGQSGTDPGRISVYGLGEGSTFAMLLATATGAGVPKVHSLGLLQPLPGRYLDLITTRVQSDVEAEVTAGRKTREQADQVLGAWTAAVQQARTEGTVPAELPGGLSVILNPSNVKAVVGADAVDPEALAARIAPATPVLLTCSDSDAQADCEAMTALTAALAQTALDFVQLKGVSHVLKDDPTDSVADYAKGKDLSPQFVSALDTFANK